ncbi:MAG: 30S ribosomal protein S16 [Bacteroidetes bacterium]|nr:30S ribosomal protein S16 [Bacteroidota bacterium]
MSVRMRLSRKGRRKQPFYHIVIADQRRSRDGKFIEKIGTYNPMTKPATIDLDRDKALEWVQRGAQPSDTVRAILKYKGVLYHNHLLKGVAKGALTEEKAEQMYSEFIEKKEGKIEEHREKSAKEKEDLRARLFGTAPKVDVQEEE